MKSILIVSEEHSENLGDGVISHVAKEAFKNVGEFPVRHLDISYIKWIIRKIPMLEIFMRKISERFYCRLVYVLTIILLNIRYRSVNKIIFAGGAILQDYFLDSVLATIKFANDRKIKVCFFSVGYAKISSHYLSDLQILLKDNHQVTFTTRDNLEYVVNNIWKDCSSCPDIALLSNEYYERSEEQRNLIGFGCIDPSVYSKGGIIEKTSYIDCAAKFINELISTGYLVELFTNGNKDDYDIATHLYSKVKCNKCSIAPRPLTDDELIKTITKYGIVVSSRLHSLIISYSFSIPTLMLSWDHKIDDFADLIESNNVIDLKKLSKIDVVGTVNNVLNVNFDRKKDIVNQIHEQIREFVK